MNRAPTAKATSLGRAVPLRFWIEAAVVCVLGMEVLWLAGYYRHLSHIDLGFGTVLAYLFGVGLVSQYLGRWLNRMEGRAGWARLILMGWLVGVLLLGLKLMVFPFQAVSLGELAASPVVAFVSEGRDAREFWTLAFTLWVALRGMGLARGVLDHTTIFTRFQFGLFALFIFGWLVAPALRSQAIFSLVWMIFLGLVAIFSHKMVRRIEDFGNQAAALDTWWTRNLLVTALLVSCGGVAVGWLLHLLAPPVMQAAWALIKLLIGAAALVIVGVVQVVAQIILELMRALNLDEVASTFFNRMQQIAQQVSVWSEENLRVTDDPVNMGLWIGLAVAVLLVVLFLIVRRWRAAAARSAAMGRQDWTELIKPPPQRELNLGKRRPPRGIPAAERVRFMYAQLMELCEKLDTPRAGAVTPLEFLPTLEELFPNNTAEVGIMTQAYLRVRYGEFPEDKEGLHEVTQAWEALSKAGEKYYQARKQAQRYAKL